MQVKNKEPPPRAINLRIKSAPLSGANVLFRRCACQFFCINRYCEVVIVFILETRAIIAQACRCIIYLIVDYSRTAPVQPDVTSFAYLAR